MVDDRDFFTIAQEGLESYITNNPRVKRVIKSGIINGYTKTRVNVEPDVFSEKDLPLIRLIPVAAPSNVNFASNLAQVDYTVRVELVTGSLCVTSGLSQLTAALFALMCAATRNPPNALTTLTWKNYEFCKNLSFTMDQIGVGLPGEASSIQGWLALCEVTLHLYIPATYLEEWANLE